MTNRRSFVLGLAACAAPRWLPQVAKPKPLHSFIDVTSKSGVHFRHQSSSMSQKYLPESMGAGVAMFDYDDDGYQDLFFFNGARLLDPMPSGASPTSPIAFGTACITITGTAHSPMSQKMPVCMVLRTGWEWPQETMTTMATPTCSSPTWAGIPCTGTMEMARSPTSQQKREWVVAGGALVLASWITIGTACWI